MLDRNSYIRPIEDAAKPVAKKFVGYLENGKKAGKKSNLDNIAAKTDDDGYYIKCNTKYRAYNPFSEENKKEDLLLTRNKDENPYIMLKVEPDVFNQYLAFLQTREVVRFKMVNKGIVDNGNKIKGTFVMSKESSQVVDEMKNFIRPIN